MRIAIISDIHSNCYALRAVLNEINQSNIEKILILGDIFGYYPWAVETYKLLLPVLSKCVFIKGNHDQLLLTKDVPTPVPSYWDAAKQNEEVLKNKCPDALSWLANLRFSKKIIIEDLIIKMYHGTPDDPENGRYYPTNLIDSKPWYPSSNTIIFMGHTHYPISDPTRENIYNPGSVGQSRDGNPMPSWGIFDTKSLKFTLTRSVYNNLEVMAKLKILNWDNRTIAILNKKNTGNFSDETQ